MTISININYQQLLHQIQYIIQDYPEVCVSIALYWHVVLVYYFCEI